MPTALSSPASLIPPSEPGSSQAGLRRFEDPVRGPIQPEGQAGPLSIGQLIILAEALVEPAKHWEWNSPPLNRHWELMLTSESFEAWVIAWPPSESLELHDHGGSSGAIAVATGSLVETTVATTYSGDLALRTRTIDEGHGIGLRYDHVHDVTNDTGDRTVSVHVYSPRLTSVTFYDFSNGVLSPGETVRYTDNNMVLA